MRDQFAATDVRHAILGAIVAVVLAACGGGDGGGNNSGGGGDGGGGGGGGGDGGGGGGGGTSALPTETSSSQSAYVTSTAAGWDVVPLLTVGDADASSYAMVGKPDGLGAFAGRVSDTGATVDTGQYMTVVMNHEIRDDQGTARAHGTRGAFVSQWTFDLDALKLDAGRDLANQVYSFTGGAWTDATGTLAFSKLCSADLPDRGAFYNASSGKGYDGRLFTTGEEVETEGRAFAFVVGGDEHGRAYELPYLGRYAHENVLANPDSGDTTIVVSMDDDAPGPLYVYLGTKSSSGNPVERAGLHGGKLYGVRVTDGGANYGSGAVALESKGAIDGTFELVDVSDVVPGTGAQLQATSTDRGVTRFARPEDGAWDTQDARVLYFVTTGAVINGVREGARLYKLTFDSLDAPTGGTLEPVVEASSLTGSDGDAAHGFDNVTVDGDGHVVIQEDGGDGDYVSKIWRVDPSSGEATQVLESDRARFGAGGTQFLTADEENSGVIEVTDVVRDASWYESGRRYYLGTNQAHYRHESTALVEGGQLYLFASPK
jgi:hypothetical protein